MLNPPTFEFQRNGCGGGGTLILSKFTKRVGRWWVGVMVVVVVGEGGNKRGGGGGQICNKSLLPMVMLLNTSIM